MDYSIRPEEHHLREARQVIEGALATCKAVVSKEEDVTISLGWDADDFMDEVDGATGRCHGSARIELYFNSGSSRWKESLKSTTAHEFAHAWFHEQNSTNVEDMTFVWQQVLMDAHAQLFAEKITDYEDPISVAVEEDYIKENWSEIKEEMSKEFHESQGFFYGGGEFETWTGYTVAYLIGQKLLEEHELGEFPELKRSDVLEAGDALFE
jgi:uncharacterized protein YjaZ